MTTPAPPSQESVYLIPLRRSAASTDRTAPEGHEVLLAMKNVYLPPHGGFAYAALGSNAAQYVLPGGALRPQDATPVDALQRILRECLGMNALPGRPVKLFRLPGEYSAYALESPNWGDADRFDEALASGSLPSLAYQSVCWISLDDALGMLGPREPNFMVPWVTSQVTRALEAGFTEAMLNRHAQMSHTRFSVSLAALIAAEAGLRVSAPHLEAGGYGPGDDR